MADWKQEVANRAEQAVLHELVQGVIDELLRNLKATRGGLVEYGITKVALYAASVARAQALGFDPNLLRLSGAEVAEEVARRIQAANAAGVPVWVIVEQETSDA